MDQPMVEVPGGTEARLPETPPVVEYPFEFRGEWREYFRIWIVNVALTVLTLGVYSAWAKVRTERYFYGNTRVAERAFDYQAQPWPILVGRLIGVALFGAYVLVGRFLPTWQFAALGVLFLIAPWAVARGLKFRARYSAWSGLNFRFVGSVGRAYVYFLLWYLTVPLTVGLTYPFVKAQQKQWVVDSHRYGSRAFSFNAETSDFYAIYLSALGIVILLGFGGAFLVGLLSAAIGRALGDAGIYVMMGLMLVTMYGAYFLAWVFIAARIANLTYNSTALGAHRLRSTLRTRSLFGIYLANTALILLTVGLAVPWAMVRLARYRAAHTTLLAQGDIDAFLADTRQDETAVGAEVGDLFDVDIGL